jgi:hypothetical protein
MEVFYGQVRFEPLCFDLEDERKRGFVMSRLAYLRMTRRLLLLLTGLGFPAHAEAPKQNRSEDQSFRGRLVLFGVQSEDNWQEAVTIQSMSADGKEIRTLLTLKGRAIEGGRVSPDGLHLAYKLPPKDRKEVELWLLDAAGQTRKLLDRGGLPTAWSADSKQVVCLRRTEKGNRESGQVQVESGKVTRVSLPRDYFADDWNLSDGTRTCIYMNPRNWIYREKQKDRYPLRQLDLMMPDGKLVPISKDPASDNLWSRFSPDGRRLTYSRRRFVDGRPKEYGVVCKADGSEAKEVIGFTDFADSESLYSLKPLDYPAWSTTLTAKKDPVGFSD